MMKFIFDGIENFVAKGENAVTTISPKGFFPMVAKRFGLCGKG